MLTMMKLNLISIQSWTYLYIYITVISLSFKYWMGVAHCKSVDSLFLPKNSVGVMRRDTLA